MRETVTTAALGGRREPPQRIPNAEYVLIGRRQAPHEMEWSGVFHSQSASPAGMTHWVRGGGLHGGEDIQGLDELVPFGGVARRVADFEVADDRAADLTSGIDRERRGGNVDVCSPVCTASPPFSRTGWRVATRAASVAGAPRAGGCPSPGSWSSPPATIPSATTMLRSADDLARPCRHPHRSGGTLPAETATGRSSMTDR